MYRVAILGCENSHANAFLKAVIKDKIVDDIEFMEFYDLLLGKEQLQSYEEFFCICLCAKRNLSLHAEWFRRICEQI